MPNSFLWISGASSGIGAALAATQPYPDARVIDISRSGGTTGTEHLPADLSDPDSWSAVGAHFLAQLGEFTGERAVFIHCAGTLNPMGYAAEVDASEYRRNVLLNAASPQVLGQLFLQALARSPFSGQAHLVILTSGAASTPYEGWSGYCAGKAAVDMWVRAAGAEQDSRGGNCRVLAVAPGTVATDMQEQIRSTDAADFPQREKFQQLHDSGSLVEPREAARGIWHLLERELDNGSVLDLRKL